MSELIKPEGKELLNYLNEGYAICNECGALMDHKDDPSGIGYVYDCPSCDYVIDTMEYEYDWGDEEREWTSPVLEAYDGDVPSAGCRACGGPYPQCKTSCKLFDY